MLRMCFTSVFLASAALVLGQDASYQDDDPAVWNPLSPLEDQILLAQATPRPPPAAPAPASTNGAADEPGDANAAGPPPAVTGIDLSGADVQIETVGGDLMVIGTPEELAMIRAIAELLDQEGPRKEIRIVTLQKAGATKVAEKVQNIWDKMTQGTPRDRPENKVTLVAVTSSIVLIAAPSTQIEEVVRIVETIDTSIEMPPPEMMTFEIKHRKASEAATQLKSVLDTLRTKQKEETGPEFEIIPIDANNTILITAPESERTKIQRLLDAIDVAPVKGYGESTLVVFPLLKSKAKELTDTINSLLKTQEGAKTAVETIRRLRMLKQMPDGQQVELPPLDLEKPFKIIADEGTESLIVATVEENIEPIGEIIKLLDGVPLGEEMGLRLFPLKFADAKTLGDRLKEMFDAGKKLPEPAPGGQSSTVVPEGAVGEALVYNVGLIADHRTNTLIVSGRPAQIALVTTIVERLDIPSSAVKFPLRLITLKESDATRIGKVIEDLWTKRIESIQAGEPGASAVEREKVFLAVDIRSNSLIVSASEENYDEIVEITKQLDGTADRLIENIRLKTCKNASAADLASKIEELWERKANLRREGDVPEDLPVIVADQRSNTLVIASSPEDFEEIVRLIDRLESQPLAPIAQIRLITLKHNDASSISDMLKQLFEERMQQRLAEGQQENPSDRVALANDAATNTLLVASSKENYDEMMRIIGVIDAEPDFAGILQVFTLKNAEATNVAEKINELFEKGIYMPNAAVDSPLVEERKKVALVADPRANAIIASASKPNLSIIENLIKTMDTENAPRPEQDTRIFTLGSMDALRVVEMLNKLFEGMKANAPQADLFQSPTIIADERSNSLIVSGTRDALKRAEDLITRITAQQDNRTATFEIYPLKHASAAKMAAKMQEMFDKRNEGGDAAARTPVFIQADEASNVLILTASRDDHQVLKGLLELLDKPSSISNQFEIFPLKVAKAESVAERLDSLFKSKAQGTGGGDSRADVIAVEPDTRTNALIVWAAPSEMENIGLIISKLDTSQPAVEMQLRVIQLKNALAEDFAEKFTETISGGQQGGGTTGGKDAEAVILTFKERLPNGAEVTRKLLRQDITVTPDPRTNAVLVMAPAESMEMLENLIRQIDKMPPQVAEIRLFPLINGDAEEIVEQLEKLFGDDQAGQGEAGQQLILSTGEGGAAGGATAAAPGGEAGSAQTIRFAADRRTNTVIAAGSEADLSMAERLVAKLDASSADERITQVYQAKYAPAVDLTSALKDFVTEENERMSKLDDESSLMRQAERHITVIGDEASNSVLLGVSPRYYSNVMEMVRQIDRPPPQVMIQALIAEVTLDDTTEFGMEFALQDLAFTENAVVGPNGTIQGDNKDFVAGTDVGAAGSGSGFSFSITGEDFSFLLHALQSEGMIEVLSRPTILVENNETANITIGDEAPFVSNSSTSDSGQVSNTVQYKDVGIILDVTPHINPDGYVNLEVKPEISSINPSGIPISEGLTAPTFAKRSAETVITVKDGETVVIGGLINTRESRQESKVPIVGDIPGLGMLFRATNHLRQRTELLILLTVDVIRDEHDAYQMSVEQRDKSGLLPEKILRSPLMEGLRILPDEEAFGPKNGAGPNDDAGHQGEPPVPPADRRRHEREDRELYGPTPDVYGPTRPQRVENADDPGRPIQAAFYGPVLPKRDLAAKP